ncbi:MAG TPA: prolyl oligopeptidase family serine peptidase [Candidatus Dormibacteraeota bacterium]
MRPPARRLWPSPVTAAMAAAAGVRFEAVQLDGGEVYWVEGRPTEAGRCVITHRDVHGRSAARDVIAAPFSARTYVHEYGGGALLAAGSHVLFSNAADRRLYLVGDGGAPRAITPDAGDVRYADMELDPTADGEAVFCVVEDHRGAVVVNSVGRVSLASGEVTTVAGGNDFYATPRVSPDGTRMCWLTWNQPLMPWEGTELWMAWLDCDGVIHDEMKVAGGPHESVFQPAWSADSTLHFVSDRTGWWNLYRWDGAAAAALAPMPAECGRPQWMFGTATYGFLDRGRIALCASHDGVWRLHLVDTNTGAVDDVDLPYTSLGPWIAAAGDSVVVLAGGPRDPSAIVHVDASSGAVTRLSADGGPRVDDTVRSEPEHLTFPGQAGETAHAWYYRPHNARADAGDDLKPPLLVHAHGGPTGATSTTLNAAWQYWTSRGIAVLDVDYGGSTGYGRAYRKRLDRMSGVVDVGDCVAGARYLADRGDVDGDRLFIEGGSAGGYIVLCAMTFHRVFAAGASLYGIGDLEMLFAETHKFEARYEHPYPEDPDELYARSPVHFADRVRKPLLLLQGLDDPIVPPDQSAGMYDAVRLRGVPCAYVTFAGEKHGFRRAENIERTETAEMYFFCRTSGIEPPGDAPPLPIANL